MRAWTSIVYQVGLAIMRSDLEIALHELLYGYAPTIVYEYIHTMGVNHLIAKPKHVIMACLSVP